MSDNNMNVFSLFCGNLSIPEETIETISKRLHTITKRINIDYWDSTSETDHCLVVGSYGRRTAIKASDIDVVIELPWSEYNSSMIIHGTDNPHSYKVLTNQLKRHIPPLMFLAMVK